MPLVGVRSALRVLRQEKPHWSLGDLAHELGVSRERVRQLLLAEGLPTKRRRPTDVFDDALKVFPPGEALHETPECPGAGDARQDTVSDDAESVSSVPMRGSVQSAE